MSRHVNGHESKHSGGGALELGDLRLLEDGSECGSALFSDVVAIETAQSMGEVGRAREQACRCVCVYTLIYRRWPREAVEATRDPRRPKRFVVVSQGQRGHPATGSRPRTPSYKFTSTKVTAVNTHTHTHICQIKVVCLP